MSGQLFEVSGVSLDGVIEILYGTALPGESSETSNAPVGSVYYTTSGATYKKLNSGSGADKWLEAGGISSTGILSVKNIAASAPTIVDSIEAINAETAVWSVTIKSTGSPANRITFLVTGSHNGTTAKHTIYSRMVFGTVLPQLSYDVQLTGGFLQLLVSVGVPYDVECYRLTAVSRGTVTVTGTGGGDVTTTQLQTETNARIAADAVLNSRINSIQVQMDALATGGVGGGSLVPTDAPYYGVATLPVTLDEAFVLALPNRAINGTRVFSHITLSADIDEAQFYAYPVSFGIATFTDLSNGFETTWDGATGTGPATVSVNGVDYYIYQTDNTNLGVCDWAIT